MEIDCKIEFSQVSDLKKDKLIEKVYDELLTESDCLTRLSKLKKFDFESYKSDLENYLIDKKYKRKNTVANRVDGLANRQVITS